MCLAVLELESFPASRITGTSRGRPNRRSGSFQTGTSIEVIDPRGLLHHEESMVTQHACNRTALRTGCPRRLPAIPCLRLCMLLAAVVALSAGCGRKKIKLPPPVEAKIGWSEVGIASWYGHPYHGRQTSNGETYDMNKMTAAHTPAAVRHLGQRPESQKRKVHPGPHQRPGAVYRPVHHRSFPGRRVGDPDDRGRHGPGPPHGHRRSRRKAKPSETESTLGQSDTRAGEGAYEIQIGSFKNEANAKTLAWAAKQKGHRVEVKPFRRGGPKLYRVVVSGRNERSGGQTPAKTREPGFQGVREATEALGVCAVASGSAKAT